MSKTDRYLKMKTPADLLTVRFFSSSGQLKGEFVQEQDPPWTIWWHVQEDQSLISRLGNMLQGSIGAPEQTWEEGIPGSALRQIAWVDLFRKAVIKKEPTQTVAEEVILMTGDREVFFTAVKKHFMLQQGQCEFAVFESGREYFLLKIVGPSLWVFNTLPVDSFTWYNLLPGHSGIYMETGWRIHDISGPDCFNQFKILDGGILMIQKDGRLLQLKPSWRKGESVIKIATGRVDIPQKDVDAELVIQPGLRKTDRHQLATFWKIDDPNRLKAIVANEALENFRNYRCWYCTDGRIFLLARDQRADRAVASILSDAFQPFSEVEERVMVPLGHLLTPRLSAERLHKFFGARPNDYLCFDDQNGEFSSTMLSADDMLSIEDFVALEVERAITRSETIKPGWKFEFRELKKKKQLIEIEVKTSRLEALKAEKEGGEVLEGVGGSTAKRRKPSTVDLDNVPELSASETASLKLQILEIDRQLNSAATRADLWEKRSDIARRMRMKNSAIAAMLNAAVLSGRVEVMVDCAGSFCSERPDLATLFEANVTELEKGRLLSAIRSEKIFCEFHYTLLLVFAARFNDRDIFNQAVEGMKKAFAGENREFYSFNESRVASGGGFNVENRVELLSEKDYPRIEVNVKKFLLQIGCCRSLDAIKAVKMQLFKMLSVHLNESCARSLVGNIGIESSAVRRIRPGFSTRETDSFSVSSYFIRLIEQWPESASEKDLQPSVSRWLKLMSMEKIRETPLRDFFTGELYRPPFMFYRKEEDSLPEGMTKKIEWLQSLPLSEFPEVSDGKPLARVIYRRFSDGHKDWDAFFRLALRSNDYAVKGKAQRLLLLMVSEYGPHPVFADCIEPLKITPGHDDTWDIYRLTMYCDMYRLCLAFHRPIDEQRLFNMLINRIPQPPSGWEAFIGSAEWIIMCLLLTSSPVRRFQLDNLAGRAMKWLDNACNTSDQDIFAQTMMVLSFLSIGILADLVPEKLEMHQLLEKRRVFWIQHAFSLASQGEKAFLAWQKACS